MDNINSQVYFITKPHFLEALMTLSFRRKVNWLEEGLSLVSWEYKKVAASPQFDINVLYKEFKSWDGNEQSAAAGHRSISVGDVILNGSNPYLVVGGGWVVIPNEIWNRVKKID